MRPFKKNGITVFIIEKVIPANFLAVIIYLYRVRECFLIAAFLYFCSDFGNACSRVKVISEMLFCFLISNSLACFLFGSDSSSNLKVAFLRAALASIRTFIRKIKPESCASRRSFPSSIFCEWATSEVIADLTLFLQLNACSSFFCKRKTLKCSCRYVCAP